MTKKVYFRHTIVKIWSCSGGNSYFPQLEIKAHFYTTKRGNTPQIEGTLHKEIDKIKKQYDYNDFFDFDVARRRIGYEVEAITKEEVKPNSVYLTVWDDNIKIRNGFPQYSRF